MIHSVYIEDAQETHAPPTAHLLEVSGQLFVDEVILSIVDVVSETNETTEYKTIATVGVKVTDLLAALSTTNGVNVDIMHVVPAPE